MDIFELIDAHARAMRLPLFAVTLSAVARKRTPVILMLHWHGFQHARALRLADIPLPARPVPSSGLCLRADWDDIAYWDQAVLDAAWQLGAWEVERATHRAWWRLNAPAAETLACLRAFGQASDTSSARVLIDPDDDTGADLARYAATQGYVRWLFRPRAHGLWQALPGDDGTLQTEQRRSLPCPVRPLAFDRHRAGRRLYRLGKGSHLKLH